MPGNIATIVWKHRKGQTVLTLRRGRFSHGQKIHEWRIDGNALPDMRRIRDEAYAYAEKHGITIASEMIGA